MSSTLLLAIRATFVATVLLGLLYPLVFTGLAQALFPSQANGSLLRHGETVVGSALIGQNFSSERYFQGRPSAAGQGYDATSSGASNLAPSNAEWIKTVHERARVWQQKTGSTAPVPIELVTTSGSGLDPHLSVAAARYQISAVARARNVPPEQLDALIERLRKPRQWGVFGEPRINVLELNAALDQLELQAGA